MVTPLLPVMSNFVFIKDIQKKHLGISNVPVGRFEIPKHDIK